MKKENAIEEIKYELRKLQEKNNLRTLIVVFVSLILVAAAIGVIVYKIKHKLSCDCVADNYSDDDFDDEDYIDYEDDDEVFEDYRAADFEGQED